MKKSNILNVILAAALVIVCAKMAVGSVGGVKPSDVQDSVLSNIMTRTSIRAYQNKAVEADKVEKLLRAAMAAPTAVNKQPWHFVVITDKKMLAALAETSPNASMVAQASLAIVVCGDMKKALDGGARDFWIQDASAASENILLAAHAMGLGAVWTGTYPDPERCAKVAKLLKLPQTLIPLNAIVIGYPAENPAPKDKWKPENISYNFFGGKMKSAVTVEKKSEAFKEIDVEKDFRANAFTFFQGNDHGILIAAGDRTKSNAMTIGWGGIGTLWGKNNAVTVYVAEKRYTKQFMDRARYFTVMTFDDAHSNIPDYMGRHSGRDGDKAKALGLHTLFTEHGTPYYAEAEMVIECEMMYAAPFNPAGFKEVPQKLYSDFPAGIHTQYIGRVVKAMRK